MLLLNRWDWVTRSYLRHQRYEAGILTHRVLELNRQIRVFTLQRSDEGRQVFPCMAASTQKHGNNAQAVHRTLVKKILHRMRHIGFAQFQVGAAHPSLRVIALDLGAYGFYRRAPAGIARAVRKQNNGVRELHRDDGPYRRSTSQPNAASEAKL